MSIPSLRPSSLRRLLLAWLLPGVALMLLASGVGAYLSASRNATQAFDRTLFNLALAFSNRWFPPKAIRIWTELHEFERLGLVADLLAANGNFHDLATCSRRGLPRPEDDPHQELPLSDPVFMAWGFAD